MFQKKETEWYVMCCWFFAFLLITGTMWAQTIRVTGVVKDGKGEPQIGVSVILNGTKNGVNTDLNGAYEISVPARGTLSFSAIGMKKQEIAVNNRAKIDVIMQEDALLLEALVVVGFGTQKKENLTGSVSTVDTKLLEARPIADVGRGLQGSTPGLSVVIPSGEVGSDPIMKIRGQFGSMQGGSSPLILMDKRRDSFNSNDKPG